MNSSSLKFARALGALAPNRHNKGWPRFQLLTYVTETEQSWRYCIEPMGYRDAVWERSGYVELIVWSHTYIGEKLPSG